MYGFSVPRTGESDEKGSRKGQPPTDRIVVVAFLGTPTCPGED